MERNNSNLGCIIVSLTIILVVTTEGYFYTKTNYLLPLFGKVTFGKIIEATNTGRATKSIIYEYRTANGQTFTGSNTAPSGFLSCWKKRDCIGKYYIVKYLENYPKISYMYLNEEIKDTLKFK